MTRQESQVVEERSGRHRAGVHRAARLRRDRVRDNHSRLMLVTGLVTAPAAVMPLAGMSSDEQPAPTPILRSESLATSPSPAPSQSREASRSTSSSDAVRRSQHRGRPTPAVTERPSRPQEPPWLRSCASPTGAVSNGAPDATYLCSVPDTEEQLTKDAARSWMKLAKQYAEAFDEAPCITDSYRSLADQASLFARKPGLAARPGTSNHGRGVALDLCGGAESFTTDEYSWLTEKGHRWGWTNPRWAQVSGSRPEPWHWEYDAS